MKTILITRSITDSSPINSLRSEGYSIIGESFLKFEPVPFDTWDRSADMVLFYSQRGVQFSCSDQSFLDYCSQVKIATFGTVTAEYLSKNFGLKPNVIGTGDPEKLKEQLELENPKKILFVQGQQSLRRLQTDDSWRIPYSELVTYKSIDRIVHLSSPPDILVFTSPLNVEHYFAQYDVEETQSIWSIGPTTAASIRQYSSQTIHLSDQPTEASLAEAIKTSLYP